jgi:hypothetical protein
MDLKSFNGAWAGIVLGGFFGGALIGFLAVKFLVELGIPRRYLGLPDE